MSYESVMNPKLDMKKIKKIPKMSEKELDREIEKLSKGQGWEDV